MNRRQLIQAATGTAVLMMTTPEEHGRSGLADSLNGKTLAAMPQAEAERPTINDFRDRLARSVSGEDRDSDA